MPSFIHTSDQSSGVTVFAVPVVRELVHDRLPHLARAVAVVAGAERDQRLGLHRGVGQGDHDPGAVEGVRAGAGSPAT